MKWLIMFFIVALDQTSKWLVVTHLKELETIQIVEGYFHLHYLENRGAAFGIFQDQRWFFVVITVLIVGGILGFLIKNPQAEKVLVTALSLITGGAVGNFIDRLLLGYVIDFLDFQIWPVFNVADSAIVMGQLLLIFYLFRDHMSKREGESIGQTDHQN